MILLRQQKHRNTDDIRCDCGKLIAIKKNGVITIKCRGCGKIIPLIVLQEPKGK